MGGSRLPPAVAALSPRGRGAAAGTVDSRIAACSLWPHPPASRRVDAPTGHRLARHAMGRLELPLQYDRWMLVSFAARRTHLSHVLCMMILRCVDGAQIHITAVLGLFAIVVSNGVVSNVSLAHMWAVLSPRSRG
eukprot:767228-Prymnesium_polylepis.1